MSIRLEHQDSTDIAGELADRPRWDQLQVDTTMEGNAGVGLFGTLGGEANQPAVLPSAP